MNPQDPNNSDYQRGVLPGTDSVATAMASLNQPQMPDPGANVNAVHQLPKQANPVGPDIASDKDVIEKSWVKKAEQIVSMTKRDPYSQAKALNALKADYINKRYGKQVRVVEE